MTARRLAVLVVLPALVLAGAALAGGGTSDAKPATARFHDLDTAIAAGYSFRLPELSGNTCITEPGVGGMGVHQVNMSLLDGTIDATAPEALVYEPRNDGSLKLVALEYVVFQADWKGSSPPELFGKEFVLIPSPNRFGLPAFYALHAWLWKPNPSGLLATWNPNVTCET
jgi:hypothetical protein